MISAAMGMEVSGSAVVVTIPLRLFVLLLIVIGPIVETVSPIAFALFLLIVLLLALFVLIVSLLG